MKVPQALTDLIESFERLPGIGPKTAQRLAYYLLHVPQAQLSDFAKSLENLKKNTLLCSICKNVSEGDPCSVCTDSNRDREKIMVVEHPLDTLAIEKTSKYKGLYHVLHGAINPLEDIGPDEIFIKELLLRIKDWDKGIREVIIATNPNMEGDATAMYIARLIRNSGVEVKISRLGMGIPTGADLEYADEMTLTQAIEGRRQM
jgi:recombination protein RecR